MIYTIVSLGILILLAVLYIWILYKLNVEKHEV